MMKKKNLTQLWHTTKKSHIVEKETLNLKKKKNHNGEFQIKNWYTPNLKMDDPK